jgi:hypothetical protein
MGESEPPGHEVVPVFGDSAINRFLSSSKVVDFQQLRDSLSFSPNLNDQLGTYELRAPRPATISRARQLLKLEIDTYVAPANVSPVQILIHHHCASNAVFEVNRQLSVLDTAFRRAAAAIAQLERRDRVESWPRPMLPNKCGLLVVDTSIGSVDTILVVYGSLVQLAQSAPVSVASLVTLIWDATKAARRIAWGWVLRVRNREGTLVTERT